MSWLKVPETDSRFPKWLKRENLIHEANTIERGEHRREGDE